MTESSFNFSEIKLALKRKGLAGKKYKLISNNPVDVYQEYIAFLDTVNGSRVSGKIVTSSNERDYWPLLNHENVAPLFDVLNIRGDLKIYITTDIQVKLKDMIHQENFVYNSRCFDRKKAYAKGIFSGLSYIHSKSLCLMNLSDDNIYICKTHDKAVITNFSSISSSRKTVRDKLKVIEHYKAPETEKHEFDAFAAEMWASGTLMLDLFLAHMVPWAVIDYKPRRVMEMVNRLSLDLLQAANAGSVVADPDLVKFKTFLKCFFRESQSRITPWLASIASFLNVKSQNETSSRRMFNLNCSCFPQETELKYPISAENPPKVIISETESNVSNYLKNSNSNDVEPQEYFDYNDSSEEIYLDSETTNCLKLNGSSDSNCSEKESFSTVRASSSLFLQDFNEEKRDETNVRNNTEIACDKQIRGHVKPYHCSENKEDSFSTSKIFSKKTFESCQTVNEKTNELSFKFPQSKSLTFTNQDGISCGTPVEISFSKNYLYQASLPVRKSNESNLKMSDFCLDRLFENKEWSNDSTPAKKVISHKVQKTVNTRNLHESFEDFVTYDPKKQKISPRKIFPQQKIRLPSRYSSPVFKNKMSIQRVKERFVALRKAEASLKNHRSLFISEELAEKQKSLIKEYLDLLRQEKITLCEVFSKENKLSISEVQKLFESFGSRPRCTKKVNIISRELQFSSSEFSDCKITDMREIDKITHSAVENNKESKDSKDGSKLKPRKRRSYCKAIESVDEIRLESKLGEKITKDPNMKNTLILTETKPELSEDPKRQNATNRDVQQVAKDLYSHQPHPSLEDSALNVKLKDSKELYVARKVKKKSDKNIKTSSGIEKTKVLKKKVRKPLCFSLCPGGRVEESTSYFDLCEACKLSYGAF